MTNLELSAIEQTTDKTLQNYLLLLYLPDSNFLNFASAPKEVIIKDVN